MFRQHPVWPQSWSLPIGSSAVGSDSSQCSWCTGGPADPPPAVRGRAKSAPKQAVSECGLAPRHGRRLRPQRCLCTATPAAAPAAAPSAAAVRAAGAPCCRNVYKHRESRSAPGSSILWLAQAPQPAPTPVSVHRASARIFEANAGRLNVQATRVVPRRRGSIQMSGQPPRSEVLSAFRVAGNQACQSAALLPETGTLRPASAPPVPFIH